ncbi:MAG: hypothetical protein JNM52_07355 [Betaproteobacteria bacterium]|nr:hypothetical protein [Betaproteobacteria bacterium]
MRHTTFLVFCLSAVGLLLGGAAWLVYDVDPFQQYRLAAPGKAWFPRALQRYINPGLAKHADYDLVITGSSLMENYELPEVNRLCRARAINLSLSAMGAFEQRKLLTVALQHRHPQRVVMSLDFNSFATAPDQGPVGVEPLPLYLYDDNPFNDHAYLLNLGMLRRAWVQQSTAWAEAGNPDRPWNWDGEVQFGRRQTVAGLDPLHLNKRFQQAPRTLAGMQASFEANIVPLVAAYPQTSFDLLFPPYSILVWADFAQRGQVEVSLDFKRYVFLRMASYANVRVFDLQWDATITHDLDRYKDIYHYDPAVNRLMLEAACKEGARYRVTATTLPSFIDSLREQALRADPVRLVEAAAK